MYTSTQNCSRVYNVKMICRYLCLLVAVGDTVALLDLSFTGHQFESWLGNTT